MNGIHEVGGSTPPGSTNSRKAGALADDLRRRLVAHNAGQSLQTTKFNPWRLLTYIASRCIRALFQVLPGRVFVKKRFRLVLLGEGFLIRRDIA